MVFRPALIPYKFLIRVVRARALMKRSFRTILNIARSWQVVIYQGPPVDLPGTKIPVASCLWRMRLAVTRVRATRPAIAFCYMPWWASASTSCLIPIGVGRIVIRAISENWENMQLFIQTCHSEKADCAKWLDKLHFWTLMIPLGIEVEVRPR